jgi:hypothetical protein
MLLREYLYIDEKRLDSYFQQITPPITFDKVPGWEVGMKLSGPEVRGLQTRHGRPYTNHEKIEKLLEYLENINHYGTFRTEQCWARKVLIPPKPEVSSDFKGITLWVTDPLPDSSSAKAKTRTLCLLQDFPHSDDGRELDVSVFSSFEALLIDMKVQLADSAIPKGALNPSVRNIIDFGRNPSHFLQQLGAKIFTKRKIYCLYRHRFYADEDTLLDEWDQEYIGIELAKHGVEYGYAIFIIDSLYITPDKKEKIWRNLKAFVLRGFQTKFSHIFPYL